MIAPKFAIKKTCPKCGFSCVNKPKSDCLSGADFLPLLCPKCGSKLNSRQALPGEALLDKIFSLFRQNERR